MPTIIDRLDRKTPCAVEVDRILHRTTSPSTEDFVQAAAWCLRAAIENSDRETALAAFAAVTLEAE